MVQDETLAPYRCPLGRVNEVHKGKDDLVRVMTVKMKLGIYRRPIIKIAMLLPEEKDN